jgi:hypothetical protein
VLTLIFELNWELNGDGSLTVFFISQNHLQPGSALADGERLTRDFDCSQ